MVKKQLVYMILILTTWSCDNLNNPGNIEIKNSISSIIVVNKDYQKLSIFKILKMNENIGSYPYENNDNFLVKDAEIELYSSDKKITDFYYDSERKSYYSFAKYGLEYNRNYKIQINSRGQALTGETYTPGNFELLGKRVKDTLNFEGMIQSIKWTESKGAKMYFLRISEAFTDTIKGIDGKEYIFKNEIKEPEMTFSKVYDKYYNAPEEVDILLSPRYDSVKVSIIACDNNYYNYFVKRKDPSGIENAFGYFCSAVIKSKVFVNKNRLK